jgi:hypothetical protein
MVAPPPFYQESIQQQQIGAMGAINEVREGVTSSVCALGSHPLAVKQLYTGHMLTQPVCCHIACIQASLLEIFEEFANS